MNKKGFIWNLIGSTVYALTSMLMGSAVMRFIGADNAGIFIFAFSTIGQHIYTVSYFGMRPVQITDTARRFSFGDYRRFRIRTCLIALSSTLLFAVLYARYNPLKLIVIIVVGIFKIMDGLCDCYESEFQRDGRLDLTGISLTCRMLAVMIAFVIALKATGSLFVSCVVATAVLTLAWVIFCEMPVMRLENCDMDEHPGSMKGMFDASKWLFLSTFLDLYVFSASKYAIDAFKDSEISGYYGILFIPTSAINVMANFLIRPLLTKLSGDYDENKVADFKSTVKKITYVISGLTVVGMIIAVTIGIPVLSLLVGKEEGAALMQYKVAFMILIAGGGFYALLNLYYYALVILKEQKRIFNVYVIGSIAATVLCFPASYFLGINGAAISYALVMAITASLFGYHYVKKIS